MIVVDSSALIAVLFEEPEKQAFQEIVDGDERCILSAVNAHEAACVLRGRHGAAAVARFWQWLIDNEIEIDPKAGLNLADCAAYALAGTMNCPLLFKGNDFTETEVKACL